MPIRVLASCLALLVAANAAGAAPVYKDRERFGPGLGEAMPGPSEPPPYADPRLYRAPPPLPFGRPVNGGPGYVGSDYGLGKPAYTGLGSRPDWGRSE